LHCVDGRRQALAASICNGSRDCYAIFQAKVNNLHGDEVENLYKVDPFSPRRLAEESDYAIESDYEYYYLEVIAMDQLVFYDH
jgi:hypothetical protein